jgi:tetratricopeptide (TPR) repeat protein
LKPVSVDNRDTTSSGGEASDGSNIGASLQLELERLATANPFEALRVSYEAATDDIRASFLQLTKKYHPNRYARMDREVIKLANEVFLRVKDAYTRLADDAQRAKLLDMFAPKPKPRPAAPAADNGHQRAVTATWRGSPGEKQTPTSRRSARGTPSRAKSRKPQPTPGRTASGTGSTRTRQGPAPAATAGDIAAGLQDTVRRRNDEYEMALRMLTQGRYHDARVVFHKIAAEEPQTKKYRVQLHYAWGLEHEDAGKFDDARREYERALAVDPEFKRAHEALDKLPGDKKGGGFFKKLFGR